VALNDPVVGKSVLHTEEPVFSVHILEVGVPTVDRALHPNQATIGIKPGRNAGHGRITIGSRRIRTQAENRLRSAWDGPDSRDIPVYRHRGAAVTEELAGRPVDEDP